MSITTSLIILLLLGVGVIALQIFLSRREARWPGLVLPGLSLLWSLVAILGFVVYTTVDGPTALITYLLLFVQLNLSTIVLLAIYFICRSGKKRKKQLEKMNIQDL